MRSSEFWLPVPPNVANIRGGWRKRHTAVDHWGQLAVVHMMNQGIRMPRTPWPRARVFCHFFLYNRMDEDNLAARQKPILDLLKKGKMHFGFFEDDSPTYLEVLPPRQSIDRKHPRVYVYVQEVDASTGP